MKTKPTLTDEEIRSHMDFDKLLQLHKTGAGAESATPKWLKIMGYTASAVLITSVVIYSLWPSGETPTEAQLTKQTPVAQADSAQMDATNVQPEIKEAENSQVVSKPVVKPKEDLQPIQEATKQSQPIFTQAEPVDGYPELYAYFNRELKYPIEALKDSVEGVSTVSFAINVQGKAVEIKISNSLGELFDVECKRVVENMPAWRPATVNGSPISTRMSIPLTFRITQN